MKYHHLLLPTLLLSLVMDTEGAKGSLRAGVMSRTNLRRKHRPHFDSSSSWDGELTGERLTLV